MWGLPKSAFLIAAAAIAGVGALAILTWQALQPAPVATVVPRPAIVAPSIAPPSANPEPAAPPPAPAPNAVPAPTPLPQFDVVRVAPEGETVVAGRAQPDSSVFLLDRGKEIDHTTADATGQFAIVPKPLAAGDHLLSLRMTTKEGTTDSTQNVAVWVPSAPKGEVMVALAAPGEPTKILSDPTKPQEPPSNSAPASPPKSPSVPPPVGASDVAAAVTPVTIRSIEAEAQGSFFATGTAAPGAKILLYLNNTYVTAVTAGVDGRWSLKVEKGMKPGQYAVRADQVEPTTGKVLARAEAPFNYPAPPTQTAQAQVPSVKPPSVKTPPVAAQPTSAPSGPVPSGSVPPTATPDTVASTNRLPQAPAATTTTAKPAASPPPSKALHPTADAVVKDLVTATVERGDSLWRISRKMYGSGMRYTQIYEANTGQIRNPHLIYPGQIFVVPNGVSN